MNTPLRFLFAAVKKIMQLRLTAWKSCYRVRLLFSKRHLPWF